MTDFDRRKALQMVGAGCVLPLLGTRHALAIQHDNPGDNAQDALLREIVRLGVLFKSARSGAGELRSLAAHLRVLDAMSETSGWKRIVSQAPFPSDPALDRAVFGWAERLTAAGLATQPSEILAWKNALTGQLKDRARQAVRRENLLIECATALDNAAEMLDEKIKSAGVAGSRHSFVRLIAISEGADGCEGLRNAAFVCHFSAFLFSFIPPLEPLAAAYEVAGLAFSTAEMIYC